LVVGAVKMAARNQPLSPRTVYRENIGGWP
jgi:hypothetical protein